MDESSLISVGLAGNGDEVDAIENVERVFTVELDVNDAPSFPAFSAACLRYN